MIVYFFKKKVVMSLSAYKDLSPGLKSARLEELGRDDD